MSKKLEARVVERYINEYYKLGYSEIDGKRQPNFWEAVKVLSLDINADVSELISHEKNSDFCVVYYGRYVHISELFKGVTSTLDAAKLIAKEIIQNENNDDDVHVELFLLKKKMEKLQDEIECLKPNIEVR